MLIEDMERLRNTMSSMRDTRARFIQDLRRGGKERSESVASMAAAFHDARVQMAREMQSRLTDESRGRRDMVAAMAAGFHAELARTSQKMQAEQRDLMVALGDETERRSESVASMLAAFHDARVQMARETSAQLVDFVSGVKGSVGELKEAVTNLRGHFAADIAGARRAFFGPVPGTVAPPAPTQLEPQPEDEVPEEAARDDLTRIYGIGPRLQEHLYDLGICTFEQLAEQTAQGLHQLLGDLARRANLEGWIKEARTLA